MTAEVALMNKLAVALAADSAVTFTQRGQQKIYNAANKVFALSKYHPVGIMVYGSAEFMGTPWETIIKQYRVSLGQKSFPTVTGYYNDFVAFLSTTDAFSGPDVQRAHALSQIRSFLLYLRKRIEEQVDAVIQAQGQISEDDVRALVTKIIQSEATRWEGYDYATQMDEAHRATLKTEYGKEFALGIDQVLQKLPISDDLKDSLINTFSCLFTKDYFTSSQAGIVVAGFGSEQVFPSLRSVTVEARVGGRLKYKGPEEEVDITTSIGAAIVPFAQSDVVDLFIQGVDPTYKQIATSYLGEIFSEYPKLIAETIPGISPEQRDHFITQWRVTGKMLLKDFGQRVQDQVTHKYVGPMLDVVEALPKNELASLAEALVNLTSLKRKVSLEAETVGGPVDVAVISKGDGLIWVQRKHYFDPRLNQHFFANYFRDAALETRNE